MSSHEEWSHGTAGTRRGKALVAELFDVDVDRIESLSWSLGNRVTVEDGAATRLAFDHRRSNRSVTVFETGEYTCVIRLRTPVGRERFYSVAAVDLEGTPAASGWIRIE